MVQDGDDAPGEVPYPGAVGGDDVDREHHNSTCAADSFQNLKIGYRIGSAGTRSTRSEVFPVLPLPLELKGYPYSDKKELEICPEPDFAARKGLLIPPLRFIMWQ